MSVVPLGIPVYSGKNGDVYKVRSMLIKRTNRISVSDACLPCEIPYKGFVQAQLSKMWMDLTEDIIPNHFITDDPKVLLALGASLDDVGTVSLVRECIPLPFEAIVRGYYIPSSRSWDQYKVDGTICGIKVPEGLQESERLPEPIFTPSTKETAIGKHDELISFDLMVAEMIDFLYYKLPEIREYDESLQSNPVWNWVGDDDLEQYEENCTKMAVELCEKIRDTSIELYNFAHTYAEELGIIVADTKFEFGLNYDTFELTLIDEVLTPDSSRYWDSATYQVGKPNPSMDKQFARDYVHNECNWHGIEDGDAPELPIEICNIVSDIYCDIFDRLHPIGAIRLSDVLSRRWYEATQFDLF